MALSILTDHKKFGNAKFVALYIFYRLLQALRNVLIPTV